MFFKINGLQTVAEIGLNALLLFKPFVFRFLREISNSELPRRQLKREEQAGAVALLGELPRRQLKRLAHYLES